MNAARPHADCSAYPQLITSVARRFSFEAAHQLPWHTGKCAKLHGHSYRLDVTVTGPVTGEGIVIDFTDLKSIVSKAVLADYDHAFLNDFLANPTAELIATDIAKRLLDAGLAVSAVTVHETANCSATVEVQR
ncbi:MAG: 6-carboxytetrahydropterin synthase QueD [Mycobacterium kyogaense]|uniref:6-carboxytetrahydropterin synthase QueD n=1 Tax=Mycobacterium kyogaense TaxID=2212479 RepID=UPI002FF4B8A7